jgi:hypothetical protein
MSTPQDVRDPARAVASITAKPPYVNLAASPDPLRDICARMAAMNLEIQHRDCAIKIALHHLKHERLDQAARVLRAAVEQPK